MRRAYPDDLTDEEWDLVEPFLTKRKTNRGRRGIHSKRELLNAILYLLRTGCQRVSSNLIFNKNKSKRSL